MVLQWTDSQPHNTAAASKLSEGGNNAVCLLSAQKHPIALIIIVYHYHSSTSVPRRRHDVNRALAWILAEDPVNRSALSLGHVCALSTARYQNSINRSGQACLSSDYTTCICCTDLPTRRSTSAPWPSPKLWRATRPSLRCSMYISCQR